MLKIAAVILLLPPALPGSVWGQVTTVTQPIEKLRVDGFAQGAVLSPDGSYLAYTGEGYNGVNVLNLETGKAERVCSHLGAGWGIVWLDNGHLIVRSTREGASSRDRMMGIELIDVQAKRESLLVPFSKANRIEVPQKISSNKAVVRNRGRDRVIERTVTGTRIRSLFKSDEAWLQQGSKIASPLGIESTPGGREILSLVWSPDGRKALVELKGRPSLYVFEKSTRQFYLVSEQGERPAWVNNDLCVYMETSDDGHNITGGEIFLHSLTRWTRQNLTEAFDGIALNPTASKDGRIVFNTLAGDLFSLKIALP